MLASLSAPAGRTDRGLAAAVAAAAVAAGTDRVTAIATRVLDAAAIQAILTQLQGSTLDPATARLAKSQRPA